MIYRDPPHGGRWSIVWNWATQVAIWISKRVIYLSLLIKCNCCFCSVRWFFRLLVLTIVGIHLHRKKLQVFPALIEQVTRIYDIYIYINSGSLSKMLGNPHCLAVLGTICTYICSVNMQFVTFAKLSHVHANSCWSNGQMCSSPSRDFPVPPSEVLVDLLSNLWPTISTMPAFEATQMIAVDLSDAWNIPNGRMAPN